MALYCLPTLVFLVIDEPAVGFVAQCLRGAGTLVVDVLAITALQRSVPPTGWAGSSAPSTALMLAGDPGRLGPDPASGIRHLGLDAMLWFTGLGVPALCLLGAPRLRRMDAEAAARRAELAPRSPCSPGATCSPRSPRERWSSSAGASESWRCRREQCRFVRATRPTRSTSSSRACSRPRCGRRGRGRAAGHGCRWRLRGDRSAGADPAHGDRDRRTAGRVLRIDGEAFLAALTQDGRPRPCSTGRRCGWAGPTRGADRLRPGSGRPGPDSTGPGQCPGPVDGQILTRMP